MYIDELCHLKYIQNKIKYIRNVDDNPKFRGNPVLLVLYRSGTEGNLGLPSVHPSVLPSVLKSG